MFGLVQTAAAKEDTVFIQVMEGKCRDEAALEHQMDVWRRELRPGAAGHMGSAGGVTSTGDFIMMVRFENEEFARRNSERPEQSSWWQETQKCFAGPVTFHDSTDVTVVDHGLDGDCGFVQVMEGHVSDLAAAHRLDGEGDAILAEARPDLMGAITAYYGDNEFCSVAYFTSEADARRAESREMPPEIAEGLAERQSVVQVERYLDLAHPWLESVS